MGNYSETERRAYDIHLQKRSFYLTIMVVPESVFSCSFRTLETFVTIVDTNVFVLIMGMFHTYIYTYISPYQLTIIRMDPRD